MLLHAHGQPNAEKLVESMKEKAIFIAEYGGGRDGGAHLADADVSAEPPPPPPDVPAWLRHRRHWEEDYDEEEEVTEEQVAAMIDTELLAFVRCGGSFKGGKGKNGRKGGWRKGGFRKGGGDRRGGGAPPPRGRDDLRCINCGGKGHTFRDCREKELPRDQRPCLNCGKPVHISRDCKQARAAVLDGGADRQQQQSRHFNLDIGSEARVCAAEPPETPNVKDSRWKRSPQITDHDGFRSVINGSRPRVSCGDLPVSGPKMSQREQREFRFSRYAHSPPFMMAREPADVSFTVLAAPVGGFESAGVTGGCVEPVVATEHHGSGAGLTVLECVEAELDRGERALTRVLAPAPDGAIGSNHNIAHLRAYSDIVKCNMNPTYQVDSASAGVQAQVQRR